MFHRKGAHGALRRRCASRTMLPQFSVSVAAPAVHYTLQPTSPFRTSRFTHRLAPSLLPCPPLSKARQRGWAGPCQSWRASWRLPLPQDYRIDGMPRQSVRMAVAVLDAKADRGELWDIRQRGVRVQRRPSCADGPPRHWGVVAAVAHGLGCAIPAVAHNVMRRRRRG